MMGPVVKFSGLRGGKQRGLLINSKVFDLLPFSHLAVGCGMQRRVRRVKASEKRQTVLQPVRVFIFLPCHKMIRGGVGGI